MKRNLLISFTAIMAAGLLAQPISSANKRIYESTATTTASEPVSFGEWSALTYDYINGLDMRARLVYAEDPGVPGSRMPEIYVELENTSGVWDNIYLYFDSKNSPIKCELRDSSGKVMTSELCDYDGPLPEIGWLTLPHDSILRLNTTLPGTGRAPNMITVGMACWYIPKDETNGCYLSGTLSVPTPKDEIRSRAWQGTINLPPVKIPPRKT